MSKEQICIVVYGCAKNHIDGEEMAERLNSAGFSLTSDKRQADLIVVHTCGFIKAAKEESILGILKSLESDVPVLATGCLTQRYGTELLQEIPEISGVSGTSAPKDIVTLVRRVLDKKTVRDVGEAGRGAPGAWDLRLSPGDMPWTYVRVSEGCRHRCTYCAIPKMRGPLCSRSVEDIKKEVESLASNGVKEINLIAQDLTDYGLDLFGYRALPDLLMELSKIEKLSWIRLLYLRPDGVTEELGDSMNLPKVLPYADLPVEHGVDGILRKMGRPTKEDIVNAVNRLRKHSPKTALRTTVITGFPGETEKDVQDTMEFLEEMGFIRVGAFPFSKEEGTPSYLLEDTVDEKESARRAEAIRKFGLGLAKKHSDSLVGKTVPVLVTEKATRPGYLMGRAEHQAPEVDGRVFVNTLGTNVKIGDIIPVTIVRAGLLDLFARPL